MAEEPKVVFEKKERLVRELLAVSQELKEFLLRGDVPDEILRRKENLISEISETDRLIKYTATEKKAEIPEKTIVNINSLLNDLIKAEKENESIISSKLEHFKGNHVNAYKKLDKNSK